MQQAALPNNNNNAVIANSNNSPQSYDTRSNDSLDNNYRYNHAYDGNPYHDYGGHTRAQLHRRNVGIAREKVSPFPPLSNAIIKILTLLVLAALIATLVVYIVYTINAFNEDRDYPKSSTKILNKYLEPIEFPAITVCTYNTDYNQPFELLSCNIIYSNGDPDKNCTSTSLRRDEWEYGNLTYTVRCWIINSKSALHTESYKAKHASWLDSMTIELETSPEQTQIGVLITAWDQVANLTNLTNPTTWTADGLATIVALERYERKFIGRPGFTEWDIYPSHLSNITGVNHTVLDFFFKQLYIEETKEEYTYNIVQVIANISAAAGELLGFSFFELYVILLALIYLAYDRSL